MFFLTEASLFQIIHTDKATCNLSLFQNFTVTNVSLLCMFQCKSLNAELHLFTCTTCVIKLWFNTLLKIRNQLSNVPYLKMNFRLQLNLWRLETATDQRSSIFFNLQITGEILSVPEYKSILLFPHPADNVTVTTNSSLAANISNGTSGTCVRRQDGWTHSSIYLLAMLSLLSLPYVYTIAFH